MDINQIEKLRTGIMRLDNVLCGGLPFGQLVLITGKAGDGKSTLANQIIVSAINENFNVFIYSGELPNYLLKAWIMLQAAGPGNTRPVKKYGNNNGTYEVLPEAKPKISEWLHDRAWIYDNRIASDEDMEQVKLIEILEEVIDRKGVRVILLDNLMTALDLEPGDGDDKYDKQSVFMKKLTRIALKHNVLILLVAHKRKMGSGEVNDTVSGSSDIVNLASIVLSYERGSKADGDRDDIRWLKVTKNRLFGNLSSGIKLTFNAASKRICEIDAEPTWTCGWELIGEPEDDDKLPWEV